MNSQPTYKQTQSYQNFGTKQKYPKASLKNRFLAALLDRLILTGLSIPAFISFILALDRALSYNHHSRIGTGFFWVAALLLCLIPFVYNFIKDGLGQGQSWGKKAFDLMVINLDNNTPCDEGKSFSRNFISGLVAIIPFVGWLIESIMVLATEDGRKLGDKAEKTQVVDKNSFKNKKLNDKTENR